MTIFKTVVTVLLTLLVVAALFIAYFLNGIYGAFTNSGSGASMNSAMMGTETSPDGAVATGSETSSVAESVPEGGFTVDISSLPDSQQGMLRTLGYENSITFTPEMVVCAEGKLGSARVAEIIAGSAPSMMESASLMACL